MVYAIINYGIYHNSSFCSFRYTIEFEYFTMFLKNKNIIFKIRRSKVTGYAALTFLLNNHTMFLKTKVLYLSKKQP